MSAALKVLQPGLHTTVQDLGRIGAQRLGIPVSGALDMVALRAANAIVGNPQGTAGLEIVALGPTLEVEAESVRVALAGGNAVVMVETADGTRREVPPLTSARLTRGERLRIGALGATAVACLAIEGGLALPPFMGSLSTYGRGSFGGLDGRALVPGDRLPLALPAAPDRPDVALPGFELRPAARARVVLGPQDDYFSEATIAAFLAEPYRVTREADRMGLRLEGATLEHAKGYNIVSDGIAPGAIQVPGSRQPIVLLADRQTTGGYPKIATVISADLAAVGRLLPGMEVRFERVTLAEAYAARRALEAELHGLAQRLVPARADGLDLERLYASNLISGVADAGDAAPAGHGQGA